MDERKHKIILRLFKPGHSSGHKNKRSYIILKKNSVMGLFVMGF